MHGAGIRGEEEAAAGKQTCQHPQAHLASENFEMRTVFLLHILNTAFHQVQIHRAAEEGHIIATAEEAVSALSKVFLAPALGKPAGANIESDDLGFFGEILLPEPFSLLLCGLGDNHLQTCIVYLLYAHETAQHIEMGLHLMLDEVLIGHHTIKHQGKPRLGITNYLLAPRESCQG